MGSGTYSADVHEATMRSHQTQGTSFQFNRDAAAGRTKSNVHESLDPYMLKFRESRDSVEHPETVGIEALLDVSGSMQRGPVIAQEKLSHLMTTLNACQIVPGPQVCFSALADITGSTDADLCPVQVGQYESDNRVASYLNNFRLKGGGGHQGQYAHESHELSLYGLARHRWLDCFEKRGKRGYAFIFTDEMAYDQVQVDHVKRVYGDDIGESIPTAVIMKEALRLYDVYVVIPGDTNHGADVTRGSGKEVFDFWSNMLPPNRVLLMTGMFAICETIATAIGINEGTLPLAAALRHFEQHGGDRNVLASLKRTFAI